MVITALASTKFTTKTADMFPQCSANYYCQCWCIRWNNCNSLLWQKWAQITLESTSRDLEMQTFLGRTAPQTGLQSQVPWQLSNSSYASDAMKTPYPSIRASLSEPHTNVFNSTWLFCCTIKEMYVHIPYIQIQPRLTIYFILYVWLCHTTCMCSWHGRMADW